MLKPFLEHVIEGRHLSAQSAREAMQIIMSGQATPVQIAGFLVALRQKGEVADELLGFARSMREHAVPLVHSEDVIDTCGTGGDGQGTLNISTAAALVAAAGGARVAKHGNRSVSSRCGSADLLEAWGVRLDLTPEMAAAALRECGITFLFAPLYHPAMKHAVVPRRELGIRTVFNLLGPLTNPASAKRQVLGVYDRKWVEPLAQVLAQLGTQHALVISSHDGLDEISPAGKTSVCEVKHTRLQSYDVAPEDLGEARQSLDSLQGGDAQANAALLQSILNGDDHLASTALALNSGAALYVAGLAPTLKDGVAKARATLESGAAWKKLQAWSAWTQANSSDART